MRIYCVMLVVFSLGVAALSVRAADKSDPERIAQLIKNLGNEDFKEREKASESLNAIGEPALDALRKALESDDAEIVRRAEELIRKIDKRVMAEKVLKPTRVHLVCKNVPVKDAVADLAKKSNFKIVLHDPQNQLADRRVTLDTGNTTFWEAFDQFCDKAGLKQASTTEAFGAPRIQPVPLPRPRPLRIRRGQPVPAPVPQPLPVPQPAPLPQDGLQPGAAPPGAPGAVPGNPGPDTPVAAPAIAVMQPGWQGAPVPQQPGVFILVNAKPEVVPTHYAGAARVRAGRLGPAWGQLPGPGPCTFFQLMTEPRIEVHHLMKVQIEKAVDDRGQELEHIPADHDLGNVGFDIAQPGIMVAQPGVVGMVNPFGQPVFSTGSEILLRFKPAARESKSFKELKGTIFAQMLTEPEPVITVDNIMKAAGKTIKGKDGRAITVLEVTRDAKGEIKIRLEMEVLPEDQLGAGLGGGMGFIPPNAGMAGGMKGGPVGIMPMQVPPGAGMVGMIGGVGGMPQAPQMQPMQPVIGMPGLAPEQSAAFGIKLVDDKGKEILRAIAPTGGRFVGNKAWTEYTLATLPKEDRREPARLVYFGRRTVTVDIPFTLKDVPLK